MSKHVIVSIFVIIALPLFLGCSQEQEQTAGTAGPEKTEQAEGAQLAMVDGEVISLQDFSDHVRNLPSKMRREIVDKESKVKVLNDLVNEKLLYKEALHQGFDKNQKVVDEMEKIKRGLILREFVQDLFSTDIPISDEEVIAYFNKHKSEYDKPERVRVSHIVTSDKGLADQLLVKIKKGENFKELAKKSSIDTTSNYKGGDLGYIERGKMPAEFDEAAFAMKKEGEISRIIKTGMGYHIIKFNTRIDAFESTLFPSVIGNVKRKIKQKKQIEIINNFTAELKDRYEVVTNEDMLDSFVVPRPSRGHGGYMNTKGGGGGH
jgi:peptidyl-prolyl cis-trans isomerase C